MELTNVSPEQLLALQSNFDNQVVIKPAEEKGKYDVSITLATEADYWRLFFAGGDYVMNKMSKQVNEVTNG